jgi:hypothetical protein
MSEHLCHWPGCQEPVAPRLWGCPHHWRLLPRHLRLAILAAYAPGQELTKQPSAAYVAAARAARNWVVGLQDTSTFGPPPAPVQTAARPAAPALPARPRPCAGPLYDV